MSDEPAITMLAPAFVQLGATEAQAAVMAAQLLKRAQQLAHARGVAVEVTLAELLAKVAAGRRGEYTGESGAGKSV